MRTKSIFIFASLALLLALSACSPALMAAPIAPAAAQPGGAVQAQTTPVQQVSRGLTVTGVGRATLTPDIAIVNIGVHTEDEDVVQAVDDNSAQVEEVRDALIDFGIRAVDIQTVNFSVYTMSNYDPSGQPINPRYAVDNSLSVTVRDLSRMGQLLGTVTRSGANNINGIQFDVSNRDEALTEAREQALENANAQATEMAGNLNVTLGDVQSVIVNNDYFSYPQPYGLGGGGAAAENLANVPISAGQMIIQVSVTVVYAIE